jgi:hypothetical protein
MSTARKVMTWIGTVLSPLLLAHFGLALLGAALAVVIILAGLYCWTVSSEDRSGHLASILSAGRAVTGQPGSGPATAALDPTPDGRPGGPASQSASPAPAPLPSAP